MEAVSGDVVQIVYGLLPGFLAAWIFYSFTAHPKAPPFERVVQALVFTALVQAFVRLLELSWPLAFDSELPLSPSDLAITVPLAAVVGVVFVFFANHDHFHSLLRRLRLTQRTSFPSEWYSAFCRQKRWVVLHLSGARRLFGWPEEWPDRGDAGHFVLLYPEWLLDNDQSASLPWVERIVLPVTEVEYVEFLRDPHELEESSTEIEREKARALLLRANKEESHGR
jgi:hypothetical protein